MPSFFRVFLVLPLLFAVTLSVFTNDEDEDYLVAKGNLTGPDNGNLTLHETIFNFNRENLRVNKATFGVCIVENETQMQKCNRPRLSYVIKAPGRSSLIKLITRAKKRYGHNVVMFFGGGDDVSLGDIDPPPRLLFAISTEDEAFFSKYDLNTDFFTLTHYLAYNCPVVQSALIYFAVAVGGWVVLTFLWGFSAYKFYEHQALSLHRAFTYLISIKFIIDASILFERILCTPSYDPSLLILIQKSFAPLFYSLFSSLALSIGMGISIATSTMNRRQFAKLLTVALISYIVSSSYYIFGPSNPYLTIVTGELISLLNVFLAVLVIIGVFKSIKALKSLAAAMASIDMNEIQRGIRRKIWMLVLFSILMVLYYGWITFYMAATPFMKLTDRRMEIFAGINALVTWTAVAALVSIFHPCFFTAAFQLGQIANEEEEEEERRELAPYLSVVLNISALKRKKKYKELTKQALIIHPLSAEEGLSRKEDVLKKVELATRI